MISHHEHVGHVQVIQTESKIYIHPLRVFIQLCLTVTDDPILQPVDSIGSKH